KKTCKSMCTPLEHWSSGCPSDVASRCVVKAFRPPIHCPRLDSGWDPADDPSRCYQKTSGMLSTVQNESGLNSGCNFGRSDPLPPNGAREWQKPTFFSGNSTHSANCLGWRRGCLSEENAWRSRSFGLPPIPRLGGRGEALKPRMKHESNTEKRDS